MAFGMGNITTQLNEKFSEMMAELKAMKNVLMQILAELQKEKT